MKHLFSTEGDAALMLYLASRPLLAFDFDGTLSPIVARPEDAGVPLAVARRLERLVRLLPIAVISGRSIADVRDRLSFVPRFIVGSHGAEDPEDEAAAALPALFDPLRARASQGRAELDAAGVTIEDKQHSLALHYRLARDRAAAQAAIAELVAGLEPDLTVYAGKYVLNVVAAQAPDKAQALARLVARSGAPAALFVGNDVNDESVFARRDPRWLTVRVGRDDPTTKAMFCLDNGREVATMLDRILALAERRGNAAAPRPVDPL
ncbi:trehalose-phosphatase [soil metagenome]